jgi:hypothetical protein
LSNKASTSFHYALNNATFEIIQNSLGSTTSPILEKITKDEFIASDEVLGDQHVDIVHQSGKVKQKTDHNEIKTRF